MSELKFNVAIGVGCGRAIYEVVSSPDEITSDIDNYGQYEENLFYESNVEVPEEPGLYEFNGHGVVEDYTGEITYTGTFTKI